MIPVCSCILIEKQSESLRLLEGYIQMIPDLYITGIYTYPEPGLKHLHKQKVDIVFLNANLNEMNGLDFMKNLKYLPPRGKSHYIFTADTDEFAYKAYQYGVSDYLVRPVGLNRFRESMDRIVPLLLAEPDPDLEYGYFFAEVLDKKIKINFPEIRLIEALGNYLIVHTETNRFTIYKPLHNLLQLLPEKHFIRVHKSFIVFIHTIQSVSSKQIVIRIGSTTRSIPVGATYLDSFRKRLRIP